MIEALMPPQPFRGRKRRSDLRAVIDAIFYLLPSIFCSRAANGVCCRRTLRQTAMIKLMTRPLARFSYP